MLTTKKKYLLTLILIFTLINLGLLATVVILGMDYRELLLMDDGYYEMAGNIVKGKFQSDFYGFGYPLILTVLYLFPKFLHPFLRLFISMLFTLGTILFVFKIFENYFEIKEIFWGCVAFIVNPLYVHWMFKSRVDAPLVLLLGLIIFCSQRYFSQKKIQYIVSASFFLAISVFTKPVFMLLPFFVVFLSLFLKSKRVFILGITLMLFSMMSFLATKRLIHTSGGREYYEVYSIVGSAFYVDAIIRDQDFRTQYMYIKDENGNSIRNPHLVPGDEWIADYEKKYKNRNAILMSLRLAYEKPGMVIQQLIVNPFLAFSLSSTEVETFFHLIINSCLLILAINGIARIKDKSDILYTHLAMVLSVYALLILVHSRGPYFIPIIPYLFTFAGKPLNHLVQRLKGK